MKKGFTLLELVVVIVIIGILATLGFAQYTRMMERARGAEARAVAGAIRTQAAALYIGNNNSLPTVASTTAFNNMLGIGTEAGLISSTCTAATANSVQYYFSYNAARNSATAITTTATRCIANGKTPDGPAPTDLTLTTNFALGTDTWAGSGGY